MSLNKIKYFGYFKLVIKQKNYRKMLTIKRFWLISEIPILIDARIEDHTIWRYLLFYLFLHCL